MANNKNTDQAVDEILKDAYLKLEQINIKDGKTLSVLNKVCPNLSVCPECGVDDFTHVENCTIGNGAAQANSKKEKKEFFDKIESLVGDAYEIGHAHGQNAFRKPAERVNEGWGISFSRIKKMIKERLKR